MAAPIDIGPLPAGSQCSNYLYPNLDLDERHQDLLTVVLPTGFSIYVGWFPEYASNGEFWIRAAWASGELPPIKTRSLSDVQEKVKQFIEYYSRPRVMRSASTQTSREFSLA